MPDTYTHGHHESVLRAHRWRTAANSAGYLLDRLAPGMSLLDVGCGPGTITLDLADIEFSSSTWTFADPESRAWWGGLWAERVERSDLARQAVDYGLATRSELAAMAAGFRHWAGLEDATFIVVSGEILARRA